MRTFSGWATIIWQSMKIPGTPLDTHDKTGAPEIAKSVLKWRGWAGTFHVPMVMLGTKWLHRM